MCSGCEGEEERVCVVDVRKRESVCSGCEGERVCVVDVRVRKRESVSWM